MPSLTCSPFVHGTAACVTASSTLGIFTLSKLCHHQSLSVFKIPLRVPLRVSTHARVYPPTGLSSSVTLFCFVLFFILKAGSYYSFQPGLKSLALRDSPDLGIQAYDNHYMHHVPSCWTAPSPKEEKENVRKVEQSRGMDEGGHGGAGQSSLR